MNENIKAVIIALEQELLLPEVRTSVVRLSELLADDFFEFGQSGNAYTKSDILADLPVATEEVFSTTDMQVKELSPNTILLTYLLERKGNEAHQKRSRRASIWQKRGNAWQMLFHQGTPVST